MSDLSLWQVFGGLSGITAFAAAIMYMIIKNPCRSRCSLQNLTVQASASFAAGDAAAYPSRSSPTRSEGGFPTQSRPVDPTQPPCPPPEPVVQLPQVTVQEHHL